ncbi:MAG: helix-turn-helix transcriptional regulator [Proteobacteria bacterium]|nr:helix-turn-helix transcriptional regulator [Pseudomonadota bacterium]
MKLKTNRFKTAREFGKAIGLSHIEMDLIQQKKKLITKLKDKRMELNISQAELANLVGTKQPAIARMETGLVSEVSMDFLLKIAMLLEMSVTIKPTIKTAA